MKINRKTDALIIIDIQNDFCPGGSLAVNGGDEIIQDVANLSRYFDNVILSQDWHPKSHSSFASTQERTPYDVMETSYGMQTLWPDHCVQGTHGAEFHEKLYTLGVVDKANLIIRKGSNPKIDSYSSFFENDKVTTTGLAGYLKEKGVDRVFLVGLAYDFCVAYSALDAVEQNIKAVVVKDLCRSIAIPLDDNLSTVDVMEKKFEESGVEITNIAQVHHDNNPKLFNFKIMK